MSQTSITEPTTERPFARGGVKGKAIAAIAAGTALLLGGAGTLAYWSTEQALTAGAVESGDLNLTIDPAAGDWTLQGAVGSALPIDPADIAAVRIVPGDVLTLVQPVEVLLEGDTLAADLTVNTDDLGVGGALAGLVDVDLQITGLQPTATNTYRLTSATDGALEATVTITFDSATANREGVNTPLNLNNVVFTLTQASS